MIVYFSKSNKTKNFAEKVNAPSQSIWEGVPNEPYILVTPTYGKGQVPTEVMQFLANSNGENLRGVVGAGNRVFGANFANAGKMISKRFGVPCVHQIEYEGTQTDVNIIEGQVEQLCKQNNEQKTNIYG